MIEIFFDFISPYAYLACAQIRAVAARVGREVEPRPAVFAAMLNTFGTRGPAEVPARRAYLMKDVVRAAVRGGVPLELPPAHPFNPLPALRAATVEDRALRWRIIDALFAAAWGGGGGIDGPERVSAVLAAAGIELDPAATAEGKARLRANTDEALARGAFGVPTLFVDGEMFFGASSLPELEAFCRGEDPLAAHAELLRRWTVLPATASRG